MTVIKTCKESVQKGRGDLLRAMFPGGEGVEGNNRASVRVNQAAQAARQRMIRHANCDIDHCSGEKGARVTVSRGWLRKFLKGY